MIQSRFLIIICGMSKVAQMSLVTPTARSCCLIVALCVYRPTHQAWETLNSTAVFDACAESCQVLKFKSMAEAGAAHQSPTAPRQAQQAPENDTI